MTTASGPQLLLVAGPGRSGTSVATGLLNRIGYTIPQPEIGANDSNPSGFGEPKWVVWFHRQLLQQANVTHGDGRPDAAAAALVAAESPEQRQRLKRWLNKQFAVSDTIVVKDPRLLWFAEMWSRSAAELGARTVALTMLRHPAAVVTSNRTHYMELAPATRVGSWINGALATERNTREICRTWVDYDALLKDWKQVLEAALAPVGLPSVSTASPEQVAHGDELVDATLRRSATTWQQHAVPAYLSSLADRVYEATYDLARPGADTSATQTADVLAAEYAELYEHSLAITRSTLKREQIIARSRGRREGVAAATKATEATKTAEDAQTAEAPRPAEQAAAAAVTPVASTARQAAGRVARAAKRRVRAARRAR